MNNQQPPKTSILATIKSVLAAFLGVQSNDNRQRDFQTGKPLHFIVIGLLATLLFVLGIWGLVRLLLHSAGASG